MAFAFRIRPCELGVNSVSGITSRPGEISSDISPLVTVLRDKNYAGEVVLADAEWRALYLWLDANAAFYGAYSKPERLAQFQGDAIPPPKL